MKKSIKAVLLSGLVFPGVGHFSLNRYQRGMIFFVPALMSLLFIVYSEMSKAYSIAEKIESGQIPLDVATISDLITASPGGTEMLLLNIASWVILACWIGGMIDSYRLGKIADQADIK